MIRRRYELDYDSGDVYCDGRLVVRVSIDAAPQPVWYESVSPHTTSSFNRTLTTTAKLATPS